MAVKFNTGDRVVYAQLDLFGTHNPLFGCAGTVVTSNNEKTTVLFDRNVNEVDIPSNSLELMEVNYGTPARLQKQT